MLAGEPGIGKNRAVPAVGGLRGRASHGLALVGQCHPEGSASLPYQAFVEAFESYARQRDAEALRVGLGASASEAARILPALRNLLQVEWAAPENPEDDRLRLLSGARLLRRRRVGCSGSTGTHSADRTAA